jgi:hypothetical protein
VAGDGWEALVYHESKLRWEIKEAEWHWLDVLAIVDSGEVDEG